METLSTPAGSWLALSQCRVRVVVSLHVAAGISQFVFKIGLS